MARQSSVDGDATWRDRALQMEALNQAALSIAGDLDLDSILQRILRTARKLARARYGALGVPDGKGGFDQFITVGISEKLARMIVDLPRFHGVLVVAIRHRCQTLGEIYLSGTSARKCSPCDQRGVAMLASHAGVAIATANL